MFVDEQSDLLKSVVDARAVEGPALSVDEPSELSKSVADARADARMHATWRSTHR